MQRARPIWRLILPVVILILFTSGFWGRGASPAAGSAAPTPTQAHLFLPVVYQAASDLTIEDIKIIQGTSASGIYSVFIAGRATEVRVFVGTGNGKPISGVSGKICGYDSEGTMIGCLSPENKTITAPSKEGEISSTLNFKLPLTWINPGFAYHIELDTQKLVEESNRENNRFPRSGAQPFGFVTTPGLNVVVVPIEYRPFSDSKTYLPPTDDLSYLTKLPVKILPVAEVNFEDHLHYTYAPSEAKYNLDNPLGYGWIQLLSELTSLHNVEDPAGRKNYYGLVNSYAAHSCGNGCITGIGYLGGHGAYQTAAGWSGWGIGSEAAAETMVHELGHNFGRGHVQCTGRESNPDRNYPYSGGKIGQYGLDPNTGLLYNPLLYADFMSYCDPSWTSDYTYWNIHQYRSHSLALESSELSVEQDSILVGGIISPDGTLTLKPVYRQKAPLQPQTGGDYTLELLGRDGHVLSAQAFSPVEIPEAPEFKAFSLFLPDLPDLSGLRVVAGERILAEKFSREDFAGNNLLGTLEEIERVEHGRVLRWAASGPSAGSVFYRVRLSRDNGRSWQALAFDLTEAEITLPVVGDQASGTTWVEIQASDGILTRTKVYALDSTEELSGLP